MDDDRRGHSDPHPSDPTEPAGGNWLEFWPEAEFPGHAPDTMDLGQFSDFLQPAPPLQPSHLAPIAPLVCQQSLHTERHYPHGLPPLHLDNYQVQTSDCPTATALLMQLQTAYPQLLMQAQSSPALHSPVMPNMQLPGPGPSAGGHSYSSSLASEPVHLTSVPSTQLYTGPMYSLDSAKSGEHWRSRLAVGADGSDTAPYNGKHTLHLREQCLTY
jgi:hypothetical protein